MPLKRNQEYITKFFSKTREKFCDHILGEGKDKEAKRWNLLVDVRTYMLTRHMLTVDYSSISWGLLLFTINRVILMSLISTCFSR